MSILENERQEGKREGIREGAIVAARERNETIARRMYARGVDLAIISEDTDLSITELERLLLAKAS